MLKRISKEKRRRTKKVSATRNQVKTADENLIHILSPNELPRQHLILLFALSPFNRLLTNFLCQQHYEVSFCFHDSFSYSPRKIKESSCVLDASPSFLLSIFHSLDACVNNESSQYCFLTLLS